MAESIYNRILDLTNRGDDLDESSFTEMKEILLKFMTFGKSVREPRPVDWQHWEKDDATKEWRLKSKKEFKHQSHDSSSDDNGFRSSLINALDHDCGTREKNLGFKYLVVRSILTNQSDVSSVLKEFSSKNPDRKSASISEINDFVSNEFTSLKCVEKNLESLCYSDNSTLSCDEKSEPVNRTCPQVRLDRNRYVNTTSFSAWCTGRRFENKNQVTLDSAIMLRVLSFNTTEPKGLNKKVYYDLYDEYKESDPVEEVGFLEYVDEQLRKFNTTASKILNDACRIQKIV